MAAKTHLFIGMPWGRAFTGTGDEECAYEHLAHLGSGLGRLAVRDCRGDEQDTYVYPLCRVGDEYYDDFEMTEPHTSASLARELGGRAVAVTDSGHCQPRPIGGTPVKVELVGFRAGADPAAVLAAAGVDPTAMAGGWAAWLGDPATADFGDDDSDMRVETLLRIWRAAAAL